MPITPDIRAQLITAAGDHYPTTAKGTPLFNPSIVPPGYLLYITGSYDDIAGAKVGEGAQFAGEQTANGELTIEGRFLHHFYVLAGAIGSTNADALDWISMKVLSPASAPASTPGVGNANIVSGMIIPTDGGDGSHTVDGTTLEAGEINQDLSPVPMGSNCWWNWDPDASPSITPAPDQDGNYNLFSTEVALVEQVNRIPLAIEGDITPDGLKGKKLLPHWKVCFIIHREDGGTVGGVARMTVARKQTL